MPIDRQEIVDETSPHFPPTTDFYSNDELVNIADKVILNEVTEDTNTYFGEAACKFMRKVAALAKGTYAGEGNIRRDRQLESELEWQQYFDIWEAFEKQLSEYCSLFGYTDIAGSVKKKKYGVVTLTPFKVNPYVN